MRQESASSLKRGLKRGHVNSPVPREGTDLRRTYDEFYSNRGTPVSPRPDLEGPLGRRIVGNQIAQLINFYGLDIRVHGRCSENFRRKTYWLVGEWFGREYVDYLAQRLGK